MLKDHNIHSYFSPFLLHTAGKYFANAFIHYEPIGPLDQDPLERKNARDNGVPPYLISGSYWEEQWWIDYPDGWELVCPFHVALVAAAPILVLTRIDSVTQFCCDSSKMHSSQSCMATSTHWR